MCNREKRLISSPPHHQQHQHRSSTIFHTTAQRSSISKQHQQQQHRCQMGGQTKQSNAQGRNTPPTKGVYGAMNDSRCVTDPLAGYQGLSCILRAQIKFSGISALVRNSLCLMLVVQGMDEAGTIS